MVFWDMASLNFPWDNSPWLSNFTRSLPQLPAPPRVPTTFTAVSAGAAAAAAASISFSIAAALALDADGAEGRRPQLLPSPLRDLGTWGPIRDLGSLGGLLPRDSPSAQAWLQDLLKRNDVSKDISQDGSALPSLADEALVDPFSSSPLGSSELDDIFLGPIDVLGESGPLSACVAVTLPGTVRHGSLVEPHTKALFPLLLCLPLNLDISDAPPDLVMPTPLALALPLESSQPLPSSSPTSPTPSGMKRRRLLPWGRKNVVEPRQGPVQTQTQTHTRSTVLPQGQGQGMAALAGSADAAVSGSPGPEGQRTNEFGGAPTAIAVDTTVAAGTSSRSGGATGAPAAAASGAAGGHHQKEASRRWKDTGRGTELLASPLDPEKKLAACQVLAGVGFRGKSIAKVKTIKVYAFGLYVHPERLKSELGSKYKAVPAKELIGSDEFYTDLLSREVGLTVRLVVHYKGLSMEMVRRALDQSLSNRLMKITGSTQDQGLKVFNSYLSQPIAIARGTTIDFSWLPGGKLLTTIDGRSMRPIDSPNLCRAFFDLYIGDPPVCHEAKHRIGETIARILSEC